MAERGTGKRPAIDVDDSDLPPMEKKPRFPKGKKVKKGDWVQKVEEGEELDALVDPRLAAKERAKRRTQMREEELLREQADLLTAEVHYDKHTNFEDDGIQLEPFNLKQEREEGYFDANGNYVEYASQNEIKDAWLDSVVVDSTYSEKTQKKTMADEEYQELSSEDLGKIKRSIANVLHPGETISQALKRLKASSNDKKSKMSEATKRVFDQLTEDAMTLLGNGEYNVYNEEREIFEREADGYERIARARKGIFETPHNGSSHGVDILLAGTVDVSGSSSIWDRPLGTAETNTSVPVLSSDDADEFDMFGDDDNSGNANVQSNDSGLVSSSLSEQLPQPASDSFHLPEESYSGEATSAGESDYVYDSSSGYYYSSSLGYYYDPASKLYCSATSGKWYSFNDQTSQYAELETAHPADAEES